MQTHNSPAAISTTHTVAAAPIATGINDMPRHASSTAAADAAGDAAVTAVTAATGSVLTKSR